MKRHLLFPLIFICISTHLSAQDNPWSIEVSYPFNVGVGRLDLGAQYRFAEAGRFQFGASLNAALFLARGDYTFGGDNGPTELDFTESNTFLQPRLFLETTTPGLEALRWSAGLGYSWELYRAKGTFPSGQRDESDVLGGINFNVGASLDIYKNWYFKLQYDHITRKESPISKGPDLLKMGIGVRF